MRRFRFATVAAVVTLPFLAIGDMFGRSHYHGWEEDAQVESVLLAFPALVLAVTEVIALVKPEKRWADGLVILSCLGAGGWLGLALLRLSFGVGGRVWVTLGLCGWAAMVCLANLAVMRHHSEPAAPLPHRS